MLIYAKAPLFLWAEAVATACYTQNRSIIRLRHGKTPYELLHDKPPDLSFFHAFGALCYLTNDSENLGKLQLKDDIGIFIGYAPTKKAFRIYNRHTRRIIETIHVDFDELTAMASEHSSSGPALHEMTPATISSGLVPNPPSSKLFVPPSRTDWDILFQPLFDELLTPPPSVDLLAPEVLALIDEVVAPVLAVSTGSPSSTTVDQDAPSPSNSQTTPEIQSPVNDVEEDNHDIEVAHIGKDPYFGIPISEVPSDQSSSTYSIQTVVHPDHQIFEHSREPLPPEFATTFKEQHLTIGSCNYRLSTTFKPKEPIFQVALDVLTLTSFYPALLIIASVLAVYMQEFWATVTYQKHHIRFKIYKKSNSFDIETFRNMLLIFLKIHGQKFVDPLFEEEILNFIRELGYPGNIKLLSDVKVDTLPQSCRTFGTIINKCISGKVTGIDTLHLSRA
ncbi:retrovirus-related pol polyprotein from transposon TNT 1-94 [Tanacetum coccineum]